MDGGNMLPLLLPLLLLLLDHATSSREARCDLTNFANFQGKTVNVISGKETDGEKGIYVKSYVLAKNGFKGVVVTAEIETEVDERKQTIQYSQKIQDCFDVNRVMRVSMWVELKKNLLGIMVGNCKDECTMDMTHRATNKRLTALNITGDGPSRWAPEVNRRCTYTSPSWNKSKKNAACDKKILQRSILPATPSTKHATEPLPSPATDPQNTSARNLTSPATEPSTTATDPQKKSATDLTTSATNLTTAAKTSSTLTKPSYPLFVTLVVVGVVMGTALLAAVILGCWSRRNVKSEVKPTSHSTTVLRENSIYESFDQQRETPACSNKVHEIDNTDIYEPFSPDRAALVTNTNTDADDTYDIITLPRGYQNTSDDDDDDDDTYDRLSFHGNWDKKQ